MILQRNEFYRLLKENRLPSVLILAGEEQNQKQEALSALRNTLLPPGMEELNETLLDNPDTDALIAAAETLPFMADHRLVLVRDYPPLVGNGETEKQLLEYLPNVPPTTVLLFYCVQELREKKKLLAAIQKMNGVVLFEKPKGAAITTFVVEAFRQRGKQCSTSVAEYLIFVSGRDTNLLLPEIEKIAAYHPDVSTVEPADIDALATRSAEAAIFHLMDAVSADQEAKSFQIVRDLLRQSGQNEVRIVQYLSTQFRYLQQVKIMQYEKKSQDAIVAALISGAKLTSFPASKCVSHAARWSPRQVRDAVKLCLDTELALKSGRLQPSGAVDSLLLKLFLLRKPENRV